MMTALRGSEDRMKEKASAATSDVDVLNDMVISPKSVLKYANNEKAGYHGRCWLCIQ